MRIVAALLALALFSGCASSSTTLPPTSSPDLMPVQITGPEPLVDSFTDSTPLASSNAGPVEPLFALPAIPTNYGTLHLLAWGTKDASGSIVSLLEMAISGFGSPPDVAYAYFDPSGRLASIQETAGGLSVEFSFDSATQLTATLCDASLTAIGHVTVTPDASGNPQGQVVTGGTCKLTNAFSNARGPAVTTQSSTAVSGVATNVGGLSGLAALITAGAYIGGIGFGVAAIAKFKAHKDNPTQSPIGSGVALLFVASALLFIPSVFKSSGGTLFGEETSIAGIEGIQPFLAPPTH